MNCYSCGGLNTTYPKYQSMLIGWCERCKCEVDPIIENCPYHSEIEKAEIERLKEYKEKCRARDYPIVFYEQWFYELAMENGWIKPWEMENE